MNKKGFTVEMHHLVIALVFLAVFMVFVFPPFQETASASQKKSECELSIALGSLVRAGGVERIAPKCPASQKVITQSELEKDREYLIGELREFKRHEQDAAYTDVLQYFNDADNEEQLSELKANEIVAKEMTDCWEKVVHGKLGMFDEWYNIFDFPLFKLRRGDYAEKEYADKLIEHWNAGVFQKWGPPTFCIVCSEITFGKDIKQNKKVDSFTPFIKAKQYGSTGESTYEFLVKDQEYPQLAEPVYTYELKPDAHYAVLFKRVNKHKLSQWSDWLLSMGFSIEDDHDSINRLVIANYNDIVKPKNEGGESCFGVIN